MVDALKDNGVGSITLNFEQSIPQGFDRCRFIVSIFNEDDGVQNPWHAYSDELAERALRTKPKPE